jgi:hypothetical protein
MPRTTLAPGLDIASSLPADWASATDAAKTLVKAGLHEILVGLRCECNGHKGAADSVKVTVNSRIKILAVSRRVDAAVRQLAEARGVDVAVASPAEITIAASAEEIQSLFALESNISEDAVAQVVTNEEMVTIERAELSKGRIIRDPDWQRDISKIVELAVPHPVVQFSGELAIVQNESTNLATLQVEVDDNGELCVWIYDSAVV